MPVTLRSISSAEPSVSLNMSEWINGKTIISPNVNTLKNKTQNECQAFCRADDQCLFAVYDSSSSTCYTRGIETNSNSTTGLKNEYGFDHLSGSFLPTNSVQMLPFVTKEKCEDSCLANPNCDYYTLLNSNCNLNSFKQDGNYSMSMKVQSSDKNVLSEEERNNISCCMNDPNYTGDCSKMSAMSKSCDTYMTDICQKNKNLPECKCVNRHENTRYQAIKSKLPAGVLDECWFPYCQFNNTTNDGNTESYVPTDMIPTTVTYFDNDGINRIQNIKCARTSKCNITDLLNPDLKNNCPSFFNGDMTKKIIAKLPSVSNKKIESFENIDENQNYILWMIIVLIILIIIIYRAK